MRKTEEKETKIWRLYQDAKNRNLQSDMYNEYEKLHRFYMGEQWDGVESGGEEFPVLNVIKPIGKYKISMIAQNQLSIVYSSLTENKRTAALCGRLNKFAASQWEKCKMDRLGWRMIKNSFIGGDHYCYCGVSNVENALRGEFPQILMREVHKTNIYFSDEQSPRINEQEWIIISEQLPLSKIKAAAKKNGLTEREIGEITPDTDADGRAAPKCTSLLYMRLTAEGLEFSRSVRNAVYQRAVVIKGLDVYPIAAMRWEEQLTSARGLGGVKPLIANQLEINKTVARRVVSVKRYSYPTLVYNDGKIINVDDLSKVGASIAVENLMENPISSIIQYLNPAPISGDAQILQSELIGLTRELEGASEAATGQVDPTRASGEAIKAARDQSAVSLNEQVAAYRQMIEDIAVIWYKLWTAYMTSGISVTFSENGEEITETLNQRELKTLDMTIKIDISPIDPYSVLSQETALERLLTSGYIDFSEYVNALDDTSSVPKNKLLAIIAARRTEEPPLKGGEAV